MGGARCKIIIDNGLGLIRVFWCMATSLFLASAANGGEVVIDPGLQATFLEQTEALAKTCAEIQKVSGY
jgi:hypothetical protein